MNQSIISNSNTNDEQIPQEFICPITLNIMEDPVICSDGYTYERSAILSLTNSVSPITRQYINKNALITNRALKDSIERFKRTQSITNGQSGQSNQSTPTTYTNPELIVPELNISTIQVRSGWDDQIYRIKMARPFDYTDKRVRTTIIACLDSSGSMGISCSTGTEDDGFTRLNLVQHSMKTVIEMLNLGDELAMINFNSSASYIFNQVITDPRIKETAKQAVDGLCASGGKYISYALKLAYESVLRASNKNVHIMLLTDGESSDNPLDYMKHYFSLNPDTNPKQVKLTTFGFSYDIKSKLLFDISEFTGSGFNFIPDASMVGTTFCNYLANILSPDFTIREIELVEIPDSL